jgi:hypothetical protein
MPRLPLTKHTILFLAADPLGTDRMALDQEARAIQLALERSGQRDNFEFVTRWAAQPLDLLDELRKLKPAVLHFSGRGGSGELRSDAGQLRSAASGLVPVNVDHPHGLLFERPDGGPRLVSTTALEDTLGAAGASLRLVVMNTRYSEVQVGALLSHVDCVIGMCGSISDDAARNFAIGFYGGLGERESVAAASRHCSASAGT